MDKRPIGIFDSGLGGLAITKVLRDKLENEDFIYVADLKNMPYGVKTKEEIRKYVVDVTNYLVKQNVKAIVVACNTASTEANDLNLAVPVIKMIEPTIKETLANKKGNDVLLIATEKTVNSKQYENPLLEKGVNLYVKAAPEFVLLVENLQNNTQKAYNIVKEHLKEFQDKNIQTVILGCTHFGFLKEEILNVFPKAKLISGAEMVSQKLQEVVMENPQKEKGFLKIFTTKDLEEFKRKVDYFKIDYNSIEKITI